VTNNAADIISIAGAHHNSSERIDDGPVAKRCPPIGGEQAISPRGVPVDLNTFCGEGVLNSHIKARLYQPCRSVRATHIIDAKRTSPMPSKPRGDEEEGDGRRRERGKLSRQRIG